MAFAAAGGTERALIVDPNEDFALEFAQALNLIQDTVTACEMAFPTSGEVDPDRLELDLRDGAALERRLQFVESQAACATTSNGWYYWPETPTGLAPNSVRVCTDVCDRLRGDPALRIEFVIDCDAPARTDYP